MTPPSPSSETISPSQRQGNASASRLRPLEDILALLTRAGFSRPGALHIYRA